MDYVIKSNHVFSIERRHDTGTDANYMLISIFRLLNVNRAGAH
jgi:hypothetical protein